jgi:hypothetical protein
MEETIPSTGPINAPVYPSIGHEELGRLFQKFGYDAEALPDGKDKGYRTLSEPRFTAWMQTPFTPRPGEYAAVFLHTYWDLPSAISAAVLQATRFKMSVAHLDRNKHGRLVVAHTLILCGGITEFYLRDQLWRWMRDLQQVRDEVKKQSRLAAGWTLH